MDYQTFMSEVKQRTDLENDTHTEEAVKSTLQVLGRRLSGGEPSDLASQLPSGIRDFLLPAEANQSFGPEEFVQMVAERENVNTQQAEKHIRAVLSVLSEAVSKGELDDIRSQLPENYGHLMSVAQ